MKYLDVAVKTALASAFATVLSMTFMSASFAQTAADTVFTNGKVYTMNEAQPRAEAVAVKGNKIVFVGSAAEAEAYKGPGTTTIDLGGRTVLPGFVSAHDHLIASSWSSQGVQLFGAKSTEEALQRIKEYAEAHPDHKVVKGIGWDLDMFGGKYPIAADLDKAVPNRPAFILDYTIHDGWLNTAALKAGNITKDTPDTLPGTTYWVRDDKGNPTGIRFAVKGFRTPDPQIRSLAFERLVTRRDHRHDEFDRVVQLSMSGTIGGRFQVPPTNRTVDTLQSEHDSAAGAFDADFHEALVERSTIEIEDTRQRFN